MHWGHVRILWTTCFDLLTITVDDLSHHESTLVTHCFTSLSVLDKAYNLFVVFSFPHAMRVLFVCLSFPKYSPIRTCSSFVV